MTFTPRTFSVGDWVFTSRDESNAEGTFSAGTEFEIIGLNIRDGQTFYNLRDQDQNVASNVPFSDLRLSRIEESA